MRNHGNAIKIEYTVLGEIYVGEVLTREQAMHPSGRMKNHCKYIKLDNGGGVFIKNLLCSEGETMWQTQSDAEIGSNRWCEHAEGGGAWYGYRVPYNYASVVAEYKYGEVQELEETEEICW